MTSTFKKSFFPVFTHDPGLVYLDNASTTHKPINVINNMTRFYEQQNANVHRGLYKLSEEATVQFELVRKKAARLLNIPNPQSIAFTKGATESINIIAGGYLAQIIRPGDEVVISAMEHHANLIPWQQVCIRSKAFLKIIPVTREGVLDLQNLHKILSSKVKIVALTHISNTLGAINPIGEIINESHKRGIPVLIDGAQSAGHLPVNLTLLDADFFVCSAHKMFGPMGVGILFCKSDFFDKIRPVNFGGGAIRNVSFNSTEWLDYPRCLEAGTPNVGGVIGLGAACDFLSELDMEEGAKYENTLNASFRKGAAQIKGLQLIGASEPFGGITSFVAQGIHPHDVASYLASKNIAVRAGHHCTQPLLDFMGVAATVRVSFTLYNEPKDVDRLILALSEMKSFFS